MIRICATEDVPKGTVISADVDGLQVAVVHGTDGEFYVLTVPSSLRARFAGAEVTPSLPRLVIGAGGGDGETFPLAQLLERRLDAGVPWP